MKKFFGAVLTVILLGGCDADLPYYLFKQGLKQGALLLKAQDVDTLLGDPKIGPETEKYLRLSKDIIRFAETDMGMSTHQNYRHFIRLDRSWVTQIVMAARKDKLEPYLFSYPLFGELPYKGFFDEKDAVALESDLQKQGYDTYRREVEAFSTTGWLPDPIISTMFDNEARFIELLLHELTHATFYFKSEADFNEAFASWMGFKAALAFIAQSPRFPNKEKALSDLTDQHARQIQAAKLFVEIKKKGEEFYRQPGAESRRQDYFDWVKAQFVREKLPRLAKVAWNNALILSFGTYFELVPAIDAYAKEHHLSPRDYLKLVATRGPEMVQEITASAKSATSLRPSAGGKTD